MDLFTKKERKLFDWEQFTVDDCVTGADKIISFVDDKGNSKHTSMKPFMEFRNFYTLFH